MRVVDVGLYRGVVGRHLASERRVIDVELRRHRWGARLLLPDRCELAGGLAGVTGRHARVLVRRWAADVDVGAAAAGVEWLARSMYGGRADCIVLPPELLEG